MKSSIAHLAIVLLALPALATAQDAARDWYIAPTITYFDDDGERKIDDGLAGGQIAFGRTLTEHLSAEVMLGYLDVSGWPDIGGDLASLGQKHLELGASLLAYHTRIETGHLHRISWLALDISRSMSKTQEEEFLMRSLAPRMAHRRHLASASIGKWARASSQFAANTVRALLSVRTTTALTT